MKKLSDVATARLIHAILCVVWSLDGFVYASVHKYNGLLR
jgi:hypothetical protein